MFSTSLGTCYESYWRNSNSDAKITSTIEVRSFILNVGVSPLLITANPQPSSISCRAWPLASVACDPQMTDFALITCHQAFAFLPSHTTLKFTKEGLKVGQWPVRGEVAAIYVDSHPLSHHKPICQFRLSKRCHTRNGTYLSLSTNVSSQSTDITKRYGSLTMAKSTKYSKVAKRAYPALPDSDSGLFAATKP